MSPVPWRLSAVVAVGAVVAAVLTPTPTTAAPVSASDQAVTALVESLGDRSAGFYRDTGSGRTVVTVTDRSDFAAVGHAGATPRLVKRSGADLAHITATLNREARIPGTAWAVDVSTNRVVMSYDDTVTGSRLARLRSVAVRFGDAVHTERIAGTLRLNVSGGQAVYSDTNAVCTPAFNVRDSAATTYYFLTAGHCTGTYWYADPDKTTSLGVTHAASLPVDDFRVVRYTNTTIAKPGNVYLHNGRYRDMTAAGDAYVGQSVQRVGRTTGLRGGSVTALNVTVTYPQGTVYGLVRTTACGEPGDSGGPFFSGTIALGITSGGNGNCATGGTTYYQPITEVLSRYGLVIY
ncbi:MAG TPA: S1 family peptidase [Micromonosporaceae bacterium]|jgi:streptogrisin D|nr:S1 family peptidase [Micromonosporaceae bacterium]